LRIARASKTVGVDRCESLFWGTVPTMQFPPNSNRPGSTNGRYATHVATGCLGDVYVCFKGCFVKLNPLSSRSDHAEVYAIRDCPALVGGRIEEPRTFMIVLGSWHNPSSLHVDPPTPTFLTISPLP